MFQKDQKGKDKKVMRIVIRTTDVRNARLINVLDALQNFQSHIKIIRNSEIKYVLVKEVIMHRKNSDNDDNNNE